MPLVHVSKVIPRSSKFSHRRCVSPNGTDIEYLPNANLHGRGNATSILATTVLISHHVTLTNTNPRPSVQPSDHYKTLTRGRNDHFSTKNSTNASRR